MRLRSVAATNFLAIREAKIALGDVTLVASGNWQGKTSIQQAVRMALTGEPARVKLKKEYEMLIHEGQKKAEFDVVVAGGKGGDATLACSITASARKGMPNPDDIGDPLKCALDPYRFVLADEAGRRRILTQLARGDIDGKAIAERFTKAGIPQASIDAVLPLFASGWQGFDAAAAHAQAEASTAKAAWRAATGETWGKEKAEDWTPKPAAAPAPMNCPECGSDLYLAGAELTSAPPTALEIAAGAKEKAAGIHAGIKEWLLLAELVATDSPSGIPSDLLAPTIAAVNERLSWSAQITKWPQAAIRPDMSVTVAGRLLGLCSEAETWCAAAMIAEAVGRAADINFVMLDRMDVLGPEHRPEAIVWARMVAAEGGQALIFATLKEKPTMDGVTVYWLESGRVKE